MIEQMEFTTDWVTPREAWWREIFDGCQDRPMKMLEVGFYEGRSAQWWLRNVLTHPLSRLVCVDRWADKGEANRLRIQADPEHGPKFSFNHADAIPFVAGLLGIGLRAHVDAVYSDFSKEGSDIMTLACLAWRLLRPGGIYLFDDYAWRWSPDSGLDAPPLRHPQEGIDAWLRAHEPFCSRVERRCGQLLAVKAA